MSHSPEPWKRRIIDLGPLYEEHRKARREGRPPQAVPITRPPPQDEATEAQEIRPEKKP